MPRHTQRRKPLCFVPLQASVRLRSRRFGRIPRISGTTLVYVQTSFMASLADRSVLARLLVNSEWPVMWSIRVGDVVDEVDNQTKSYSRCY